MNGRLLHCGEHIGAGEIVTYRVIDGAQLLTVKDLKTGELATMWTENAEPLIGEDEAA